MMNFSTRRGRAVIALAAALTLLSGARRRASGGAAVSARAVGAPRCAPVTAPPEPGRPDQPLAGAAEPVPEPSRHAAGRAGGSAARFGFGTGLFAGLLGAGLLGMLFGNGFFGGLGGLARSSAFCCSWRSSLS